VPERRAGVEREYLANCMPSASVAISTRVVLLRYVWSGLIPAVVILRIWDCEQGWTENSDNCWRVVSEYATLQKSIKLTLTNCFVYNWFGVKRGFILKMKEIIWATIVRFATDDSMTWCVCLCLYHSAYLSVTRLCCVKTAERIEVLFGMETLWHPRHILFDGRIGPPTARGLMRSLLNYFGLLPLRGLWENKQLLFTDGTWLPHFSYSL